MDWSPLSSFVQGILQARILERIAISFSRGSSWPRDQTRISYVGRCILYLWLTREALWPPRLDRKRRRSFHLALDHSLWEKADALVWRHSGSPLCRQPATAPEPRVNHFRSGSCSPSRASGDWGPGQPHGRPWARATSSCAPELPSWHRVGEWTTVASAAACGLFRVSPGWHCGSYRMLSTSTGLWAVTTRPHSTTSFQTSQAPRASY